MVVLGHLSYYREDGWKKDYIISQQKSLIYYFQVHLSKILKITFLFHRYSGNKHCFHICTNFEMFQDLFYFPDLTRAGTGLNFLGLSFFRAYRFELGRA